MSGHKPRCILVTGGAGFIGSNYLLRMVPRNPDVRFVNMDKLTYAGNLMNLRKLQPAQNYRFEPGDITDAALVMELFGRHHISTVLHFAAESHVDRSIRTPVTFSETNVVGTAVLLEAARQAWAPKPATEGKYRFLHVSTDEVFGSAAEGAFFTESTPYAPRSPYSASKAAADHFVRAYGETYELPVLISNCSNNYGPFQHPEKLIPLCILNAIEQRPVPIYGSGANVRDWLYVDDHCDALQLIMQRGTSGSTYVVGGGNACTNLDLVTRVLDAVDRLSGRKPGFSRTLITFVSDRPGHDQRYAIDASRIREALGWAPKYSLVAGIEKTVRWYLDNPQWLRRVAGASFRTYYASQYGGT